MIRLSAPQKGALTFFAIVSNQKSIFTYNQNQQIIFMEKTIKLLSGVEAEITSFKGLQQRLITEQSTPMEERLDKLLLSILRRVGNRQNIDEKFIGEMLSEDKKKCIWEARQLSVLPEKRDTFVFNYKYTSVKKETQGKELKFELDVDLTKLEQKPYMYLDPLDNKVKNMVFENYDQLANFKKVNIKLPMTGKQLVWTLMDGKGETLLGTVDEKMLSSHTKLKVRNPVEMFEKTPVQVNLDTMEFMDIEALRESIWQMEGYMDTVVQFAHPEAALLPESKKTVRANLLHQTAFFFPSERM